MGDYDFTEEGVLAALVALGDGSEDVAESLTRLGFKGARDDCEACPVAHYLMSLWPGVSVEVGQSSIVLEQQITTVDDGYVVTDRARVGIVPPLAIAAFITDFDGRIYPHLERRKS